MHQDFEILNDQTTKPYFEFLSYSLHVINEFNTIFQSESPLLYTLKDSKSEIIPDFSNNFMEVTYVRETNPFDIDPSSEDNYLPEENICLGNLKFIIWSYCSSLNISLITRLNICRNPGRRNFEGAQYSPWRETKNSCKLSKLLHRRD